MRGNDKRIGNLKGEVVRVEVSYGEKWWHLSASTRCLVLSEFPLIRGRDCPVPAAKQARAGRNLAIGVTGNGVFRYAPNATTLPHRKQMSSIKSNPLSECMSRSERGFVYQRDVSRVLSTRRVP